MLLVKTLIVNPLAHICDLSLTQGLFLTELKIVNVFSLYKSEYPLYFSNYRPVSFLCVHCRPRVRNILCFGHKLGSFEWLVYFLCVLWNVECFVGWYMAIKPCTAEPGYWQNNINWIFAANASLVLCEEPSAATIMSDVKYTIASLNSNNVFVYNVVLILLCTVWNVQYFVEKSMHTIQ